MNVLVVSANLVNDSLLLETKGFILDKLLSLGHSVVESDLDAQGFDPYITIEEYNVEEKDNLYIAQGQAYPNNYSPDVQNEMSKLKQADVIIVITKLVKNIPPTILVGWLQRVFPIKFAIFSEDKNLDDKKFLFVSGEQGQCNFECVKRFVLHGFGGINFNVLEPILFHEIQDLVNELAKFEDFENWPKMSTVNRTDLRRRSLVT